MGCAGPANSAKVELSGVFHALSCVVSRGRRGDQFLREGSKYA